MRSYIERFRHLGPSNSTGMTTRLLFSCNDICNFFPISAIVSNFEYLQEEIYSDYVKLPDCFENSRMGHLRRNQRVVPIFS